MISKHQRWTPDGKWIPGKCKVADDTGLRKLMRAARRAMIPPERLGVIERAVKASQERSNDYRTGYNRNYYFGRPVAA